MRVAYSGRRGGLLGWRKRVLNRVEVALRVGTVVTHHRVGQRCGQDVAGDAPECQGQQGFHDAVVDGYANGELDVVMHHGATGYRTQPPGTGEVGKLSGRLREPDTPLPHGHLVALPPPQGSATEPQSPFGRRRIPVQYPHRLDSRRDGGIACRVSERGEYRPRIRGGGRLQVDGSHGSPVRLGDLDSQLAKDTP